MKIKWRLNAAVTSNKGNRCIVMKQNGINLRQREEHFLTDGPADKQISDHKEIKEGKKNQHTPARDISPGAGT